MVALSVLATASAFAGGQKPSAPSTKARDQSEEGNLTGAISHTQPLPIINEFITSKYCPICGNTYPGGTQNCPIHGVPLKNKSQRGQITPQGAQTEPAKPVTLFCPACGMQFTDDYVHCTMDGTKLEPIKP